MYYARPSEFNDPFDCQLWVSWESTEEEFKDYARAFLLRRNPRATEPEIQAGIQVMMRQREEEAEQLEERSTQEIQGFVNEQAGVLSLTERPNDILMWSHYAGSHTGLCVGFRSGEAPSFVDSAYKVRYSSEYPVVNRITMPDDETYRRALLTKSTAWSYEQEWRDVGLAEGAGPQQYPSGIVIEVIFGARISDSDRRTVVDWIDCLEPRPRLLQAALLEREYGLCTVPLDS